MAARKSPPASVDGYLAALPDDQRAALERLRKIITAAAPDAVECISYQIPAYKLDGRMLVGFAAASEHCTFHLMSTTIMATEAATLKGLPVGKGSVQFPADRMLPAALVTKLVRARIAEVRGSSSGSGASGSGTRAGRASPRKRK